MNTVSSDESRIEISRSLANRFIAAMRARDYASLSALFSSDGVYCDDGFGRLARGPGKIETCLTETWSDWPAIIDIIGPFATTDGYTFIWTANGTLPKGSSAFGVAGVGQPWSIRGTAAGTVENGHIIEHINSWNLIDLLVPLGITKLPSSLGFQTADYVSIRKGRPTEEPSNPAVQHTLAVVQKYWEVLRQSSITNDFSGLHGVFAEDLYEEETGLRHETRTIAQQLNLWNDIRAFWPHSVEVEWSMICDGGYVVTCLCKGKMEHSFAGLPGNGAEYSVRYFSVGIVEDGRIRRVRDPSNAAALMRDVGVSTIPRAWRTGEPLGSKTPIG